MLFSCFPLACLIFTCFVVVELRLSCVVYCCIFIRYANGTTIPNAVIKVAGRHHEIHSSKYGDYFRLLLPGTYKITVIAGGLTLTVNVTLMGSKNTTTLDFIVSEDTITGQTVHPGVEMQQLQGKEDTVSDPQQRSMADSPAHEAAMLDAGPLKSIAKRGLSDNAIAAVVIISIGFIVCVVAGVVLFRRLSELREVEKGYSRIGEDAEPGLEK